MKKLIALIGFASILATSAFAAPTGSSEDVEVANQNGKTYVQFTALATGAAVDMFNVFDKAGFASLQHMEGRDLSGKNIHSSVFYLNGARYNTVLTIDPVVSQVRFSKEAKWNLVTITGEMAQEFFDAMKKAGIQQVGIHAIGSETLTFGALTCTETRNSRPVMNTCSISIAKSSAK